ncbi:snaclec 3-like [Asterias amurensis]|uniref:snaclec 3-like n=1 Tax=Asterias amurensis TaxID=7602 RepID=UPI003AB745B6
MAWLSLIHPATYFITSDLHGLKQKPTAKKVLEQFFGLNLQKKMTLSWVNTEFACPNGWIEFGSSCYIFHNIRATWTEANTNCQERAGAILRIESPEENDFIQDEMGTELTRIWIDVSFNGIHQVIYNYPWKDGHPTSTENCATLHKGEWLSTVCAQVKDTVCEMNITQSQVKPTKSTPTTACYVLNEYGRLPLQDGNTL